MQNEMLVITFPGTYSGLVSIFKLAPIGTRNCDYKKTSFSKL